MLGFLHFIIKESYWFSEMKKIIQTRGWLFQGHERLTREGVGISGGEFQVTVFILRNPLQSESLSVVVLRVVIAGSQCSSCMSMFKFTVNSREFVQLRAAPPCIECSSAVVCNIRIEYSKVGV